MKTAATALTLTTLFVLLLMTACGKDTPVIPTVEPSTPAVAEEAPTAEPTAEPTSQPSAEPKASPTQGPTGRAHSTAPSPIHPPEATPQEQEHQAPKQPTDPAATQGASRDKSDPRHQTGNTPCTDRGGCQTVEPRQWPPTQAQELLAQLPQSEYQCLPEEFKDGTAWLNLENPPSDPQLAHTALSCISDESINRLFLVSQLQLDADLSQESIECLAHSPAGGLIRRMVDDTASLEHPDQQFDALLYSLMGITLSILQCLPPEELEQMGIFPEDQQLLDCIFEDPDTIGTILEALLQRDTEFLATFEDKTETCADEVIKIVPDLQP